MHHCSPKNHLSPATLTRQISWPPQGGVQDICHLGSPEGSWLAGLAGGGPSSPSSRQRYEHACTSSARGPFILCDRFPSPPPLWGAGTEGPRPPGLKFNLLIKRGWNKERKHPLRLRFFSSLFTQRRVSWAEGKQHSLSTLWPTFCHFTFVSAWDTPTGCHAPVSLKGVFFLGLTSSEVSADTNHFLRMSL